MKITGPTSARCERYSLQGQMLEEAIFVKTVLQPGLCSELRWWSVCPFLRMAPLHFD